MSRAVPLLTRARQLLASLFGSPGILDALEGGNGGPADLLGVREPKRRGPNGRLGAVALEEPDSPRDPVNAGARGGEVGGRR
jgi:hypothetical protein